MTICSICKKEFSSKNPNKKYCSRGCKYQGHLITKRIWRQKPEIREKERLYTKNWRKKNPKKYKDYYMNFNKSEKRKIYLEKNKEKLRKINLEYQRKQRTNPEFKEKEKVQGKTYREKYPDRIKLSRDKYRKSEKGKVYFRNYDKSEKRKAQKREWNKSPKRRAYMINQEKKPHRKEYKKNWLKTPIGKALTKRCNITRYAHIKGIKHDFKPNCIEWLNKVAETKGLCPNCKKPFTNIPGKDNYLERDHIIPVSKVPKYIFDKRVPKGSVYTIDDIMPLCHKCNSTKQAKYL